VHYRKIILGTSSGGPPPFTLIHVLEEIEGPAADLGACPQAKDPRWTVIHEGDRVVITRVTTEPKGA
jgi:hypothetical protein